MKKIKVAHFGAGYWGPNIIRTLIKSKKFNLDIILDTSKKRLSFIKQNFNVKITSKINDILKDETIEAVSIATPANTHYELIIKCLKFNKHVFVEKPIAMNSKQVDSIIKQSKKQKKLVMVGHTFLYNNAVIKIKELIQRGILGDLRYIYCQRLNLGRIRNDVDALWNLGIHDISIVQYFLDNILPTKVSHIGSSFIQKKINDVSFLNLLYPNKVLVNIHVSWLDPNKVRKVILVGSKKMIIFDDTIENKIELLDKGIDIVHSNNKKMDFDFKKIVKHRVGKSKFIKFKESEPLLNEMNHFYDSIMGKTKCRTDAESSKNIIKILSNF